MTHEKAPGGAGAGSESRLANCSVPAYSAIALVSSAFVLWRAGALNLQDLRPLGPIIVKQSVFRAVCHGLCPRWLANITIRRLADA